MQKLNYCKKICKCGYPLRIDGSFDNGKYVILRCNNQNCNQEYYIEYNKSKKCGYMYNPIVR